MRHRLPPFQRRSRPLNALFFTVFDGYLNRLLSSRKSKLFADLPDEVVELGAGVGANFRYLKPGTAVTAIEPNPHMHNGLRKRAGRFGIDLRIVASGAEAIDLPDDSVDAVICTLVLCTVDKPERVLAEVNRILRPGRALHVPGACRRASGQLAPRASECPAPALALLFRGLQHQS